MRSSFSGTAAGADARGAANSPLGDSTWDSSSSCIHWVISLAVPGSVSFAGEFLILAGSFQRAWWWAVIGASGVVLAAMYMLRLISAVLHEARGPTVPDEALDLRPGELALLAPLVGILLALSAWPAGISHHSFAGDAPTQQVEAQFK